MPAVRDTVPWVLAVAFTASTVRVWPLSFAGPLESLVVRSDDGKVSAVSSAVDLASATAVGASLTGVTSTLTVAEAPPP